MPFTKFLHMHPPGENVRLWKKSCPRIVVIDIDVDVAAHMDVDVHMGWDVKLVSSSEHLTPFQGRTSWMHLMFEMGIEFDGSILR